MTLAAYFRTQADTCTRLAQNCFDLGTARELREMAMDFRRKASELDAEAAQAPFQQRLDGIEREH